MSCYDFQNFLTHSNDSEILLMTETCFTTDRLKRLVIAQPETILNVIRREFKLPKNYEVAELIYRLNTFELSDVLKKHITRDNLIAELNELNTETKEGLIKHYMSNEMENIILKLKNLDRVIESTPSIYSRILTLNDHIELCNEAILLSEDKKELIEHRITLKTEINELVLKGAGEELGLVFKVCRNSKPENKLPERINIHDVFKNTIIFDFPVKNGEQDVIFNGRKLNEGNHFCIVWLGDLIGFEDSERFITLYHHNIQSISPLLGDMYVYDSISNNLKVYGVLFNQGEEVLEPRYSAIEVISQEYFKAYRINSNGEKDQKYKEVVEGWEYYDKYGKQVSDYKES